MKDSYSKPVAYTYISLQPVNLPEQIYFQWDKQLSKRPYYSGPCEAQTCYLEGQGITLLSPHF